MANEIDFYQIYYREEQKEELYDFATPYFNKTLTPYFENTVISELVPNCKSDYVSVCSWRLRQKRSDFRVSLYGGGERGLSIEKLTGDYDIAILTPRGPTHKPLQAAAHWHGRAWVDALDQLRTFIKIPNELKYAIYENHFIARTDIYRDYVSDCLGPCMDFMEGRDVFSVDSGYRKRKNPEDVQLYNDVSGRHDWPIAPFILERLFSIWIHDRGFKVVNI